MKAWLAKFRISAALDAREPLTPSRRTSSVRSEELRRFERDVATVDRALKQSTPPAAPPPDLHRSIMHALRGVQSAAPERRHRDLLRWLPAPALVACLLLAGWWAVRTPSSFTPARRDASNEVLQSAVSALEFGQQAARVGSSNVIAPMALEWERLNGDLDRAREFVLASLP